MLVCIFFQSCLTTLLVLFSDVRPKLTNDDNGIDVSQVLLQQENDQLKRRLEQSNVRIQTLIRDKERLLEISNHLRSQLNHREGTSFGRELIIDVSICENR